MPLENDPNLLIGRETSDDAGVYRLSDDMALVQTIDFITPVVNDPYDFGRIAAANSLSDVYAMGGRPLTAMNVVCFPIKSMDKAVLREILRGGLDTVHEAGAVLVGGHSVEDPEIKYGLSVTGVVRPDKVLANDPFPDTAASIKEQGSWDQGMVFRRHSSRNVIMKCSFHRPSYPERHPEDRRRWSGRRTCIAFGN